MTRPTLLRIACGLALVLTSAACAPSTVPAEQIASVGSSPTGWIQDSRTPSASDWSDPLKSSHNATQPDATSRW